MHTPEPTIDHRRAAAERSIEAILDAAGRLLAAGADASMSAIAAAAGVSRVTLYAHFPTRPQLLEALAERVIGSAAEAIAAAHPGSGQPAEALDRLIEAAWGKLDRNLQLVAAGRAELSEDALRRAHEQLDVPILALIKRGQRSGAFRKDVPANWLLATYYALMHAAAGEAHAGRLRPSDALPAVKSTIHGAFGAP
jgi:TetR/AcrR family transcriptional regulator, mexCD-oprJ operon repressor